MKKQIKKIIAGILTAACVMSVSVPAMADNAQVFVNFICNGSNSGKFVPAGSNVTAPAVPLVGGHTFCGFDKSLKNVTTNTTFTAIYLPDSMGEAAIAAKKASLPTPAISATTVADPNAAPAVTAAPAAPANTAAMTSIVQAQQAAVQAAQKAAATGTAAATAPAVQTPAQIQTQPAQIQTQPAQTAPAAQAPANQTQAAPAAQTPAPQVQAAPAVQAPAAGAVGLPSWATSLHGVDAAGCAEVYKYWKTVKNADDATIQGNWDALLNHYAGHGTSGW